MSRFAKVPIPIPEGVTLDIGDGRVRAAGPAGEAARPLHPSIAIEIEDGRVRVRAAQAQNTPQTRALLGTYCRLIEGLLEGAHKGFVRALDLVGVGYRAQADKDAVTLQLGYSRPITHRIPSGVAAQTPTPTEIILRGADKALLGQVAADLRAYRSPEPYKGKGVRHRGERVVIKETKKK